MGRPPLSIEVKSKDQTELKKLLSGGLQQVRVVLRALALLQLAKGISAPQIAESLTLTAQTIRNLCRRYRQDCPKLQATPRLRSRKRRDRIWERSRAQPQLAVVASPDQDWRTGRK